MSDNDGEYVKESLWFPCGTRLELVRDPSQSWGVDAVFDAFEAEHDFHCDCMNGEDDKQ